MVFIFQDMNVSNGTFEDILQSDGSAFDNIELEENISTQNFNWFSSFAYNALKLPRHHSGPTRNIMLKF